MQFYNLKTRSHVEVPETDIRKLRMVRKTKTGEQTRYAHTAVYAGSKVYKFISEKDFNASTAAEEK